MIRTRNRTRGGGSPWYNRANIPLISSLPSDFTYTRNDTAATYRDSGGYLRKVSAINTPRFDHAVDCTPLGLRFEPARTNKLASYNASPTDTTGWTKAGDAAATLTVVDLPAAFSALKLGNVGNGKCYKLDNSAGSTTATASSSVTFGNLNQHTLSVYAWGDDGSGNSGYLTRSGTSAPTTVPILVDAPRRYTITLTPNATGDQMRVTAKAGYITYFLLEQMEEAADASSPIVVAGASASRAADRCTMTGLDTKPYFDIEDGFLGARFIPETFPGAGTYVYPIVVSDNSTSNAYGPRIVGGDYDGAFYARDGGVSIGPATDDVPFQLGAEAVTLAAWSAAELTLMHGDNIKTIAPSSFPPSGINTLDIGARNGGNDQMRGWVSAITIGKGYKTGLALGNRLYSGNDVKIAFGGQSLSHGFFGSFTAAGRNKLLQTLAPLYQYVAVTTADGATGGTVVSELATGADNWWNLAGDAPASMLTNFYALVAEAGITPSAVFFEIGETDSNYIGVTQTKAQYKEALEKILLHIRATYGDIPVIFQTTGRKESFSNTGGVQAVREAQQELAATYSWMHLTYLYDATLADGLHPDQTGYETSATRLAHKLDSVMGGTSAGVDGPSITGAVRVGTSVTVTIAHDGGTDFTPTTGIVGFKFFDNTSEIAISAAVRTNATTITLTLASAPSSGTETLYYGYDNFPGILTADLPNLVKDNATVSMPLQTAKVVL